MRVGLRGAALGVLCAVLVGCGGDPHPGTPAAPTPDASGSEDAAGDASGSEDAGGDDAGGNDSGGADSGSDAEQSDRDGDQVPDTIDNCPDVANADQVDTDHDGIGDACDPIDANGCRPDGQEICGDGTDDNCDGRVDEGCACVPGTVQPCFAGKPAQRHVGACVDGQQLCIGDPGAWGACRGGIEPGLEVCDGMDNNCDGAADNSLVCDGKLRCPTPGSLPDARPFHDYVIDGTQLFASAAHWTWKVTGGPCDQLFASQALPSTFELRGSDTPRPTFRPASVGDYLVAVAIQTPEGDELGCSFPVHVAGSGLSVELCWDTTGPDDVDLHLHAPDSVASWFTNDDCYYRNCKGSSPQHIDWGYPILPLDACQGGPNGPDWIKLGSCISPRLDTDNVETPGVAEVITVDAPENGATYRTMANYSLSLQPGIPSTHPITNVYCAGHLVASLGQFPDLVATFERPGFDVEGATWRAADITTRIDAAGVTTCDVTPLHPPGKSTGYDVRHGDASY